MRQRLALATALLGDPAVLLLDEPANGLDPEGIRWLRAFLRHLAGQGRTVLLSSHVLPEVQQTVDEVIIINRGRLVRQAALADLEGRPTTRVRTPDVAALRRALAAAGHPVEPGPGGEVDVVLVPGPTPAEVGALAHRAGVELHELAREASDLESVFLALTDEGAGAGAAAEAPAWD
jgi:ABC-2 type transport system ATP-binding protein